MIRMNGPARLGFMVALLALLIAPLAFGFHSAQAQGITKATYYGTADAGATVGAHVGDALCAETDARADGQWLLTVNEGDCDGGAKDGATVSFSVNGKTAEQSETWRVGGSPSDIANGIALTVAVMVDPAPVATEEAMPVATEEAMPVVTPPETGNAGLASAGSSSSALMALVLGLIAVGGIAGARVSTRRVS